MMRALAARLGLGCMLGAVLAGTATAANAAAPDRPWVVVSDIHYAPYGRSGHLKTPSPAGSDTNPVLFDSFIAELARTEPNPPVIVIAGDFLGHGFPVARAGATMAYLAQRFDRAFPHTQFVITLGNNDSSCGDYESSLDAPFLRTVARAWMPLVDRGGAAPDFAKTFAHDGSYVARLPIAHYRAVVVNDVYDALRYRNACGTGNPAATSLGALSRMLENAPAGERTWLVTHIPPGVDAFSTAYLTHGLVVLPFLRPNAREALVRSIEAPGNHVALVIAGHTHHFSFRLTDARHPARDVPILVAPSVSPIFRNAPSFLTLDVARDGVVRDVTETSYLEGTWQRLGSLSEQGVGSFTAPHLVAYRNRLAENADLRATYVRLYAGGGDAEIDDDDWPIYRCAITELSVSDLRACTSAGGVSVLTRRGVRVATIVGSTVVAASIVALAVVRSRRAGAR